MQVLRTAVAVGWFAMSAPAMAQGRFGWDRGRDVPRNESRNERRDERRDERRNDRWDRRDDRMDRRDDKMERHDEMMERRDDRRDDRFDNGRGHAYGRVDRYDDWRRYDFNLGRRDRVIIGGWYRNHGGVRISVRDRLYRRDRYDLRPGVYLSTVILSRLDLLPFDLEVRLGRLPYGCERRIYGRTVVVVDIRTGYVVDVFDLD